MAKKKTKVRTAANSDRHVLYQLSVQNPEHEEEFVTRIFKKKRKRKPLSLREDFCGTAHTASYWVNSHKDRTAIGLDLCSETLAWGKEHNVDPLGEAAERVTLMERNVLDVTEVKSDVCFAMNFSYYIFTKRDVLVDYFRSVRESLVSDGLFFLDMYGGYEAQQVMEEKREVEDFIYVWDQATFNPIDNTATTEIHFRFKKGPPMRRAFTYDWRLWAPVEVREALYEAGFTDVTTYWEDDDEVWRPKKVVENQAGWLMYLVAER